MKKISLFMVPLFKTWKNSQLIISTNDMKLLNNFSESYIYDSFHSHVTFGTGGIRAKMGLGSSLLNTYTITRITQGLVNYLKSYHKSKVVIGYDTRNNSRYFNQIVTTVLRSNGIEVFGFKTFIPTPLLSFATQYLKADLGIMITASHNPPEYNGYKIYDENGCQLVPHQAKPIETFINQLPDLIPVPHKLLEPSYVDNVLLNYQQMLMQISSLNSSLNLKVGYSSLHGTGYALSKFVIESLKHTFIPVEIECKPDGNFTYVKSSNPEEPKSFLGLQNQFELSSYDIAFATDPDADRLGVLINHHGKLISLTGNQVGAIIIYYLIHNKHKNKGFVASTIVSSDLAKNIAKKAGLIVIESLTGFKYIGEQIHLRKGEPFVFGYEESFGFLLDSSVRDKDAFQPMVLLLEIASLAKTQNLTLVDYLQTIFDEFSYYEDELITFTFDGIQGMQKIKSTVDKMATQNLSKFLNMNIIKIENYQTLKKETPNGIENLILEKSDVIKYFFKEGGWVVFRPSGTEPKLKIYISLSGNDKDEVKNRFNEFKSALLATL
jgi:phosphoglucomutase